MKGNRHSKMMKSVSITRYILAEIVLVLAAAVALAYVRFRHEISTIRQKVHGGSELLTTNCGTIEYAVRGAGWPVLLLHGAGGGYDQGLLLGKGMEQGYQLIAVSRFGYLRSPLPNDGTVKAQAALYNALLEHLAVEKVIVLAGSAGGPSALQFVHDYPEKARALILVSAITMPIAADNHRFQTRLIHLIQQSDFVYWLVTKCFQSQFLALIGVPPAVYQRFTPTEQALAQEMLNVMHPMSLRREGTLHESAIQPLDSNALAEIVTPTLIFHARDDQLVAYQHAQFAHQSIPQAKLVTFESGGHGLLTRIDEVRHEVGVFVSSFLSCYSAVKTMENKVYETTIQF